MKALTVRQPHASAIIWLGKSPENRTRRTNYRGLVWIHAGLAHPEYATFRWVNELAPPELRLNWHNTRATARWETDRLSLLPRQAGALGVILGSAILTGCHLDAECLTISDRGRVGFCTPWAARDQFHWELADARPLTTPVPCRGALGLWTLPEETERAVLAQIGDPC